MRRGSGGFVHPDDIARAYDAYVDRLHDEYYREYPECPECGEPTLEVTGGRERRGWWSKEECFNDGCGYLSEDCELYDDWE